MTAPIARPSTFGIHPSAIRCSPRRIGFLGAGPIRVAMSSQMPDGDGFDPSPHPAYPRTRHLPRASRPRHLRRTPPSRPHHRKGLCRPHPRRRHPARRVRPQSPRRGHPDQTRAAQPRRRSPRRRTVAGWQREETADLDSTTVQLNVAGYLEARVERYAKSARYGTGGRRNTTG